MRVEDTIEEFLDKLEKQMGEQDWFFDQWQSIDWHERCVLLEKLLHGMWSTLEDAEDLSDSLKNVFPPYPFEEIRNIKKWLKTSLHKIDDFLEEDYQDTDKIDYMTAYQLFLRDICENDDKVGLWHSREQQLVDNERNLLDMLKRSYSVLLDVMISCYESIHKMDDISILLAYNNRKTKYEQLNWTMNKDRKSFVNSLEKKYVWGEPTKMQLKEEYQRRFLELGDTRIGKIFLENNEENFILEIAKLRLHDKELNDFFRANKELEELKLLVRNTSDEIETDYEKERDERRRGPGKHYLFVEDRPTKENRDIKTKERIRFMQYMKTHKLSSRRLNCDKDDSVNDVLTCFILHWQELKIVSESPSGGAIFRFMTEDCGFQTEVTEKSYSNEIKERLRTHHFRIGTYRSVAECFKEK